MNYYYDIILKAAEELAKDLGKELEDNQPFNLGIFFKDGTAIMFRHGK